MSPNEKIVEQLAAKASRRDFLKIAGGIVIALSTALIGETETAEAQCQISDKCCPGPPCGSAACQFCGSQCPSGWTKIQTTRCCLNGCSYTCSKCQKNTDPDKGSICWCTHDDIASCPGQNCIQAPQP